MKSSVWKSFSKNFGYKVLAFVFAFTLWLIVYNIDDPMKTRTLVINVTVTNASYLENMNKYYEIIDGTNRVSISVMAPRSQWEELDETDFTAVANLNNINIDETGTQGTVPIEITCKKSSDSIKVDAPNKQCKIALENLMSKQFVITADAVGAVSKGHALGKVEATAPTVLKVSGPESIVKKIAGIVATIDVEGMSMDLKDYVVPVLYDEEGKEIDTTRLTLSNPTVTVSAQILKTKEVPISIKPEGTPEEGYTVTSTACTPGTVEIKGSSSLLNTISAIEIPSELIDVSGAKEDIKATIDISDYLENGTELVDKSQATIEIVVSIEEIKSKNIALETKDITVTGLTDTLELEYTNKTETVTISGLKADIDKLTEKNISASIDVSNLTEGTHSVPLILDIDDTKYTYSGLTISIVLSEKAEETEATEETEEPETETLSGAEE